MAKCNQLTPLPFKVFKPKFIYFLFNHYITSYMYIKALAAQQGCKHLQLPA